MVKIAIDSGHGLGAPGREVPAYIGYGVIKEWTLNDKITTKMINLLSTYEGVQILRLDDPTGAQDIPLSERSRIANAWGADALISNHHNLGILGGNGGGLVVYRYPNSTTFTKAMQLSLYNKLIARTGLVGNRSTPLAEADFHMVRVPTMPAVLIEHGFMDSPTDMAVIIQESFSDNSAAGVVDFLVDHYNLQKSNDGGTEGPEVPPSNSAIVRLDKSGLLLLKGEIIESSEKRGFSKNGDWRIDEIVEGETMFKIGKNGTIQNNQFFEDEL